MINPSLATRSASGAHLDNISRGNPAEGSSAAADKAKFDAAFGTGVNSGTPVIGITLNPNGGAVADPALAQPHAILQLRPPGPLVAGQQVGQGNSTGMAASAYGGPGPLVAPYKATEAQESREADNRGHANPALRMVFDAAVERRRADLEVPTTVANGMEAGRERLLRDMDLHTTNPASGISPASPTAASTGEGASGVNVDPITSPMPSSGGSQATQGLFGNTSGPIHAGSDTPLTSASPKISLSPVGASSQVFSVPAPRISTAEIGQAMHNALAAAQKERPITETREKDLVRAQQERPIDVIIKDDLEAAKAKLSLPGGEQELLMSTLGEDAEALVDPEAQKALLERANALLQEKYQMILDDFSTRITARDLKDGTGTAPASA